MQAEASDSSGCEQHRCGNVSNGIQDLHAYNGSPNRASQIGTSWRYTLTYFATLRTVLGL